MMSEIVGFDKTGGVMSSPRFTWSQLGVMLESIGCMLGKHPDATKHQQALKDSKEAIAFLEGNFDAILELQKTQDLPTSCVIEEVEEELNAIK